MTKIALTAPYYCQYDNELHPGGSCNMTSLAMCLEAAGKHVPGRYVRPPDNLLAYCDQMGLDRHELSVIAQVSKHYGLGDDARYTYTLQDVKHHLASGKRAIVQGTFTPSGHVMAVLGYDDQADTWLVNDPAGHYPHYDNPGWQSGEHVWYPSAWWDAHAAPDGHVWAHLLQA